MKFWTSIWRLILILVGFAQWVLWTVLVIALNHNPNPTQKDMCFVLVWTLLCCTQAINAQIRESSPWEDEEEGE